MPRQRDAEEDGGPDACDGLDNDRTGSSTRATERLRTCDESCYTDEFDDDEFERDRRRISADDGLRLDSSSFIYQDLWVANSGDETVTRINTETNEVVGTYDVSVNPHPDRNDDDPSRTAVDFDGNAWVANRAFDERGSVVKIRGGDCVTDCVIFRVPIGDVDDLPRGLAIDKGGNAWVGTYNGQTLYKISGGSGEILGEWNIGIPIYGLAMDQVGILWITSLAAPGHIAAFDTNVKEVDDPLIGVGLCRPQAPYGIAVDGEGNVDRQLELRSLVRLDRASFNAGERPPTITTYASCSRRAASPSTAVDTSGLPRAAPTGSTASTRQARPSTAATRPAATRSGSAWRAMGRSGRSVSCGTQPSASTPMTGLSRPSPSGASPTPTRT